MLQIKQKFHIALPHLKLSSGKTVQFAPVTDDNDELTQAIADDIVQHDDEWQLNERPNEAELEEFWDEVEDDIQHDPKWIKFSDEDSTVV